MHRSFFSIAVIMLLAIAHVATASGINYASIQGKNNDTVRIKQTTLKVETWFTCSILTRTCEEAASTTPFISDTVSSIYAKSWYALIPSGGRFITESSDGRYVAYYTPAWIGRGKRTFSVLDTQTGATYSKDEPIEHWDLLTEGIRVFSFSPDSNTLLYLDDIKNHPTFYRVDLGKLNPANTALTSSKMFAREYSIADMVWEDNDTILYVANRENPYQWSLYQYTLTTG